MTPILAIYDRLALALRAGAPELLPLLARLCFAGVLAGYYWSSALTKLEGPFTPSVGAYAQIFPRALEAAGYDASALGIWAWLVVLAGSYAEFILPALLILGAFTRLAALGMIGFIVVQSLTDIVGHGVDAGTIGRWFDSVPDALIVDQRALWLLPLVVVLSLGAGRISVDALLRHWRPFAEKPVVS